MPFAFAIARRRRFGVRQLAAAFVLYLMAIKRIYRAFKKKRKQACALQSALRALFPMKSKWL
jgi:hypothetical protein